jgi:glutathione S-transferase
VAELYRDRAAQRLYAAVPPGYAGRLQTYRACLLEKKLQYINESLKDEQWICGPRFTIADAYLFTVLRWACG